MHIAFAAIESPFDETQRGGIAAYLRALIPRILEKDHEVSIFVNAGKSSHSFFENSKLHIYPVKLSNFHWYLSRVPFFNKILVHPVRQIEWSRSFYKAFKKHRVSPDVIESGELGSLYLHKIAPLVVRLHGSDYVFQKNQGKTISPGLWMNHVLEKKIYANAAALSAPSRAQAETVSFDFPSATLKTKIIANPVEIKEFKNITREASEKRIIFFSGRIAPVKDVETLLKAFARVRQKFSDARLVLAGRWQMPHDPSLWGLEAGKSKDGVEWKGPADASGLKKFYGEANLFVMPSRYETFGISVVEAMASGLAVVASRAGALPEIIENKVTGTLVSAGDVDGLAGAIIELLINTDLRKKMGEAGRKRAEEKFDPALATAQTIELYENTANKK